MCVCVCVCVCVHKHVRSTLNNADIAIRDTQYVEARHQLSASVSLSGFQKVAELQLSLEFRFAVWT